MLNDWFNVIELPLTLEQFRRLPWNPAYKYEFIEGHAWLSPRPKNSHAVLDLQNFVRPVAEILAHDELLVRPLQENDWAAMPTLFAGAFNQVQPFASLTDEKRTSASEDCLGETHDEAEGPLVPDACLVAARVIDNSLVGAIIITLPPAYAIEGVVGLPHLTWIFVSHWHARHGVGSALLDGAVKALLQLGYKELVSTFLMGNESSMLWHWKAGFRLLESPWSLRPRK